ncbi:MAG TPA: hypothetical protein P5022_01560 [Candidatus Paceibacterota bacterium]|nr:hypothetical protein [Verrucomicrobiota bacterium]HRZ91571.1 hypothetical protein [Candidatus Paceibacterota bacterium]
MFNKKLTADGDFGRLRPHTVTTKTKKVITMRIKVLLLAAVVCVATAASSLAQVYSVNAVGYVNKEVPAGGFAILSNPLNQPTNNLATVFPNVPDNFIVYKYVANTFQQITKRTIGGQVRWTGGLGADEIVNPGMGFFVKNPSTTETLKLTFVGEVPQGTGLTVPFAAGFNLISSIVPQAGAVKTTLGLPVANNEVIYKYGAAGYVQSTLRVIGGQDRWTGGDSTEPVIDVGEGFWYKANATGNWARDFSVNP